MTIERASAAAFMGLLTITVYGFIHERLAFQEMWTTDGWSRLLVFSIIYWMVAGSILVTYHLQKTPADLHASGLRLLSHPASFLPITAAFVLAYTTWWTGPLAPLAVLYFLASCYSLGRTLLRTSTFLPAIMLGTAVWMTLIWIFLHFSINTPAFYIAILGLPIAFQFAKTFRQPPALLVSEAVFLAPTATAVLVFLLMVHWLNSLKPDISSDGLSMHLALPSYVASHASWNFDFQNYIWAVMPASVDGLYAVVYMMGGEPAARLLNFAYVVLTAAMVVQAARRWTSPTVALLAASLFVSTPLTALVTGSLFIENIWTALILAAVLALLRYLDVSDTPDLALVAALTGAAAAAKLIAVAFAAPILSIAALLAVRRRHWRPALLAVIILALTALPPYLFAWTKTGNPIFPFSNATFHSPYYYTAANFDDFRFHAPLTWRTLYDVTFHSTAYLEELPGATGFQYLLLLLPAALLIRGRDQAILFLCGFAPALLILAVIPNLRYLYAALPLFSIAFGWLVRSKWPLWLAAPLIAMNLWFLPAGDAYDRDFGLFAKSDIAPYIARLAPVRPLVEHLNRTARGEPVAFFDSDAVGGLDAPSYTDSWHTEHFWKRVREADDPTTIRAYLKELGIVHVVAPVSRSGKFRVVTEFLTRWLDPDGPEVGPYAVFRVRDAPLPIPKDTRPLEPGTYEDTEPRIEYSKGWITDGQFLETSARSVTYTDVPGLSFKLTFRGAAVKYFYTRALNRGIAEVRIDDKRVSEIDAYSAVTEWQASREFATPGSGDHTLEIRVAGRRNPNSSGVFIDLDKIEIR